MYTKYFAQHDEIGKPIYQNVLEALNGTISPSLLEKLPFMSFAMLKPDAYLRGLMPEIITIFQENDIRPVFALLTHLTEELLDKLYMFVKPKYAYTWWVVNKNYSLAPSLPMLLIGDKGEYEHLSARVRALIGPTTPLVGEPSQIRYRFHATHRVLNLVHGTDDPSSAAREALIFFSLDQICYALQTACNTTINNSSNHETIDTASLVPAKVLDLRTSSVKYQLKNRLLGLFDQALTPYSFKNKDGLMARMRILMDMEEKVIGQGYFLRQERSELSDILRNQRNLLFIISDYVSRLIVERSHGTTIQRAGAEVLQNMNKAYDYLHVMSVLVDEISFQQSNFEQIIGTLVTDGMMLEAYEEVILHTEWAVALEEFIDFHTKTFLTTKPES